MIALTVSNLFLSLKSHISISGESIRDIGRTVIAESESYSSRSWRIDTHVQDEDASDVREEDGELDVVIDWIKNQQCIEGCVPYPPSDLYPPPPSSSLSPPSSSSDLSPPSPSSTPSLSSGHSRDESLQPSDSSDSGSCEVVPEVVTRMSRSVSKQEGRGSL